MAQLNSIQAPNRQAALRIAAIVAAALFAAAAAPVSDGADTASIAQTIEQTLDVSPHIESLAGEGVDGAALAAFYRARHWEPAWRTGSVALRDLLAKAGDDGLASLPLHLKQVGLSIDSNLPGKAAQGDMLLTDAVLRYAAAIRGQRVDPSDIEDDWFVPTPVFDPVDFATKHHDDIVSALPALAPSYNGYRALRDALIKLRTQTAADWPKVPSGPTIRPGDVNDRIADVRRRLVATGELPAGAAQGATYDDTLKAAVILFQAHNGLDADGALGPRTVLALNASPAQRARTVALNMERWRWLPDHLESEHIFVNVPAEEMQLVSDGNVVLDMRAIVGDVDHPTPALHARLTSLVLNPVLAACRLRSPPTRSCPNCRRTRAIWWPTISSWYPTNSCRAVPRARARASPGSR